MWRDAASVRINLKSPLHNTTIASMLRALAISLVGFLYGLPMYTEVYIFDNDMAFITYLGLNKNSVYVMLLCICI